MWDNFNRQYIEEMKKKKEEDIEIPLPDWLNKYVEYKFNLLDRTGTQTQDSCFGQIL